MPATQPSVRARENVHKNIPKFFSSQRNHISDDQIKLVKEYQIIKMWHNIFKYIYIYAYTFAN